MEYRTPTFRLVGLAQTLVLKTTDGNNNDGSPYPSSRSAEGEVLGLDD